MSHNIPPINPNPAEIRTHDISRKRMTRSVLILFLAAAAPVFAADPCDGSRDLRLINGRIVTMDARNTVLSSAAIQNGRFVPDAGKLSPCTKVINLRGRTAVPGLIDNHNHIVLLGIRPGYDTRLETAGSIADVQSLIRERAKTVPAGGFITAMGGWNIAQFAEKRLSTLATQLPRTIRRFSSRRSTARPPPIAPARNSSRQRESLSMTWEPLPRMRPRWPP